ncbi:MAG: PilZ domain-containing protein [Acidobacteria bacterium]|nr:PilZ domain-containing protein [Acidobacteriota bacterium]MCL5288601.1 PilZ domain-containing protein [Acidobacteriota bacterium]
MGAIPPAPHVLEHHEKRRSHRLLLRVPVRVQGKDLQQKSFTEETHTLVVSAHGGLIVLAAALPMGGHLLLINKVTDEQEEAMVVFLKPAADGKGEVGFEFARPAGQFWGVAFPPADWSPANLAPPEP